MSKMDAPSLTDQEVNDIYTWVDSIPLSRPKKNIGRDFADGVLMAEIVHLQQSYNKQSQKSLFFNFNSKQNQTVHHYFPKLVELHNYSQANSTQTKQYNWNTLNTKVFIFLLQSRNYSIQTSFNKIFIQRQLSNIYSIKYQNLLHLLQLKVLKKLGFQLSQKDIDAVIQVEDRAIECVLKVVQEKIKFCMENESQVPETQKSPSNHNSDNLQQSMTNEKDQLIQEQRETIGILELKITKLEQLVKLKDSKIQTLMQKLQQLGYKF